MEPLGSAGERSGTRSGFADIRADSYALLATLIGPPPTPDLLRLVPHLAWDGVLPGRLERALEALRRAGGQFPFGAVQEEYGKLFVGLGSGEMVPYASWYRERTLQSHPLATLRSDLSRLGIVRQEESRESEDHAGALCEIMALLALEANDVPLPKQARFFQDHVASWMAEFFRDLRAAPSAGFYRAVADFGGSYLDAESAFLRSARDREPCAEGG